MVYHQVGPKIANTLPSKKDRDSNFFIHGEPFFQ